jgi:hypothetical protein
MSTFPLGNNVAVENIRDPVRLRVTVNVPVQGT